MSGMEIWLTASEFAPVHSYDADRQVVVGPFTGQERLDAFLDRHGRVFRTNRTTVYTPDEYDAEVEIMELENAADTAD